MSATPASHAYPGELAGLGPSSLQPQQSQKPAQQARQQQKRKTSAASLENHGSGRWVRRRASRACQCCRARRVRCNVTEHGAPCTNCRLDKVECIVSEMRTEKKRPTDDGIAKTAADADAASAANGTVKRRLGSRDAIHRLSSLKCRAPNDVDLSLDKHVPHSIYRSHGRLLCYSFSEPASRMPPASVAGAGSSIVGSRRVPAESETRSPGASLPAYIKPLPPRIGPDEVAYLAKKGALTIPHSDLRTELLRAYVDFVYPYMPLLSLHDFLRSIDCEDGRRGKTSLILFQAVMFAGSAFADFSQLRKAGYSNRKEARRDFFLKARLLYDFDYEQDRVSLVQALLLMTYYCETPDQKDTWYWMGVATSVAHTIGLHRNPDREKVDLGRIKLRKRIWWSAYMRDRLIALGMRRPMRIKDEDHDMPLLTLDDFDIAAVPDGTACIPADCVVARDIDKQRQLAILCIQKAKLCVCISHVLSKQYYASYNNHRGLISCRPAVTLLPKNLGSQNSDARYCDEELRRWQAELPEDAKYEEASSGDQSVDLHKSLLHMVFYAALSALHRPLAHPSAPVSSCLGIPTVDLYESSRRHVRAAATAVAGIARKLDALDLVRYMPTTAVTVLLPAIVVHLLDVRAPDEETRRAGLGGFCQCMQVMGLLWDLHAAADYSTASLEAAIRKAGISIASGPQPPPSAAVPSVATTSTNAKEQAATWAEDRVDAGRCQTQTAPPDGLGDASDEELARLLETFLANTLPASDHHTSQPDVDATTALTADDSTAFINQSAVLDGNQICSGASLSLDSDGVNSSCGNIDTMAGFERTPGVADVLGAAREDESVAVDFDALLNADAMGDACASLVPDDSGISEDGESGNGIGAVLGAGGLPVSHRPVERAIGD